MTIDSNYHFNGEIEASKSLYNRALIIQSYFPDLKIHGTALCDDVQKMKSCVQSLHHKNIFDAGDAGTTFRFFAIRLSRLNGNFILKGSHSLLKRPQEDLLQIMTQLGVNIQQSDDHWKLQCSGWPKDLKTFKVGTSISSQFLSGIILNACNLDDIISIEWNGKVASESYLQMTLALIRQLGFEFSLSQNSLTFLPKQKPKVESIHIEPDMSSAFSISCAGALCGEVQIKNFPTNSLQPDFQFTKILAEMNIPLSYHNSLLVIKKSRLIKPLTWDLSSNPDLFPSLAVLCAFASGVSEISGLKNLIHKESNRIEKSIELLTCMGVQTESTADRVLIYGKGLQLNPTEFTYHPSKDHRMAMAAGLLLRKGWSIKITDIHVVDKSYPNYWKDLEVSP